MFRTGDTVMNKHATHGMNPYVFKEHDLTSIHMAAWVKYMRPFSITWEVTLVPYR
jgi:hypothetical protein